MTAIYLPNAAIATQKIVKRTTMMLIRKKREHKYTFVLKKKKEILVNKFFIRNYYPTYVNRTHLYTVDLMGRGKLFSPKCLKETSYVRSFVYRGGSIA